MGNLFEKNKETRIESTPITPKKQRDKPGPARNRARKWSSTFKKNRSRSSSRTKSLTGSGTDGVDPIDMPDQVFEECCERGKAIIQEDLNGELLSSDIEKKSQQNFRNDEEQNRDHSAKVENKRFSDETKPPSLRTTSVTTSIDLSHEESEFERDSLPGNFADSTEEDTRDDEPWETSDEDAKPGASQNVMTGNLLNNSTVNQKISNAYDQRTTVNKFYIRQHSLVNDIDRKSSIVTTDNESAIHNEDRISPIVKTKATPQHSLHSNKHSDCEGIFGDSQSSTIDQVVFSEPLSSPANPQNVAGESKRELSPCESKRQANTSITSEMLPFASRRHCRNTYLHRIMCFMSRRSNSNNCPIETV